MSEFEEETYSTIFSALKHPIRRRILRLLHERPRSFTEMQNLFKVDSPYLTYHLDSLKDLVSKTGEGNYRLSSMGESAIALMMGVEEPAKPIAPRYGLKQTIFKAITILSIVILISALIPASLYFYNLLTDAGGWEGKHTISIPADQPFRYSITINYTEHPSQSWSKSHSQYREELEPFKSPTLWEEDNVVFTLRVYANCSVSFRIYDSNENLIKSGTATNIGGSSGYASESWQFPMDSDGTWRFEADYNPLEPGGPLQPNATLIAGMKRERFIKPYYYYGIAGLLIATICPILMLFFWIWTKKNP